MNIIIPVGGRGERFKQNKYIVPKPLIYAKGKRIIHWVLESLNLDDNDIVTIVVKKELKKYQFENVIKHSFPNHNIRVLILDYDTNSPVETVLYALKNMDDKELSDLTLTIDSDTFCNGDIISKSKKINSNLIFYGKNDTEDPIYSYITVDENNNVTDVKEKSRISENICVGSYCFKTASLLKSKIEKLLSSKNNREIYISDVYNLMLKERIEVKSEFVDNFYCLGTPKQLKIFSSYFINDTKYRFCFDLDNTLVTFPKVKGDYTTVEPIQSNIDFLNFLYEDGHKIIIYTARRMKTHNGDVAKVEKDIKNTTIETLKNFNIRYHDLIFGKPYADFYIDDLSINASFDLEKETGFYNVHPPTRYFNKIEKFENYVIKTSKNIDGELYYYSNIPSYLKEYFPKIIEFGDDYIKIERIKGLTMSFLMINNEFNEKHLFKILNTLKVLHENKTTDGNINIYGNYYSKIIDRLNRFDYSIYENSTNTINDVLNFLLDYEKENRGVLGMIHGDPVFSNILLTIDESLKFIDMRGKIGGELTVFGDIFYDYAKVYQSLVGYDYILFNKEIDYSYVMKNKKLFESYIISEFGENRLNDIKCITKSLILTLLPLHNDSHKQKNYNNLISTI